MSWPSARPYLFCKELDNSYLDLLTQPSWACVSHTCQWEKRVKKWLKKIVWKNPTENLQKNIVEYQEKPQVSAKTLARVVPKVFPKITVSKLCIQSLINLFFNFWDVWENFQKNTQWWKISSTLFNSSHMDLMKTLPIPLPLLKCTS